MVGFSIQRYLLQLIEATFQSEDEALARALALSIMEQDEAGGLNRQSGAVNSQQVTVGGGDSQQGTTKDKCLLS